MCFGQFLPLSICQGLKQDSHPENIESCFILIKKNTFKVTNKECLLKQISLVKMFL